MLNKNLQFEQNGLDEHILYSHHPQILIRNAYIEQVERWKESIIVIEDDIIKYENELRALKEIEKSKSFWISLWHKITRQGATDRENIKDLHKTISELQNKYKLITDNPPNVDMYNLAMFGSNMFSMR